MNQITNRIKSLFGTANRTPPAQRIDPAFTTKKPQIKIPLDALVHANAKPIDPRLQRQNTYKLPQYAPGVLPNGKTTLALDGNTWQNTNQNAPATYNWLNTAYHGTFAEGIGFMGYPYLAELSQRAEYRRPVEIIAEEMTRKWIKISAVGNEKSEKVKDLTDKQKNKYHLKEAIKQALEHDGYFGIGMLYIDTGATDDVIELKTPLPRKKEKIGQGQLLAFRPIDPTWIAPNNYNSSDPLNPTYYKPQTWFVNGKEVSSTRLMIFNSRPVPDILKPAYNFGGIALTQMLKPYVDNWLRTRQAVTDLLVSFTVYVLETNMFGILQGGAADADELFNRIQLFAATRDNRGVLMIDKNTEGFGNVSAPLGTLDALQAQAQEHMSSITGLPLVKAFGITPSGLNASSEGEIRVHYDSIQARQANVCDIHVKDALDLIQLSEYGFIDPEITYEWVPLWQLDEASRAAVRKTEADTDAVLAEQGAISAEEIRQRVANSPDSPYAGLDPDDMPVMEVPGAQPPISWQDAANAISNTAAKKSELSVRAKDEALDQPTLTKKSVKYQNKSTHGDEICDDCQNYLGENRCRHVMGVIDPLGWCTHWQEETD